MSFRNEFQQHEINESDLRSQLRGLSPDAYATISGAYFELAGGIVSISGLDPKELSDAPDVKKAIEEIQRAALILKKAMMKTEMGRYL